MPTYQYRCTECGHDLEAVQKFTDAALTECPSCGGQLRKVYNAVGVVFKGSGFYRTDSRTAPSENGSAEKSAGGGGGKDAGAKESGSKESGDKSNGGGGGKDKSAEKGRGTSTKESSTSGSTSSGSGSSTPSKAAGS